MKKAWILICGILFLGATACHHSDQKTNAEIDSINNAKADSLLNAALADTTGRDSLATDTLQP